MEEIKSKSERFYNVDFLRFIFAIGIILFHCKFYKGFLPQLQNAAIIVEFFFIMGGFFLFKNIKKDDDTVKFAIKKLIRLAPALLFLILLTAITSLFVSGIHFHLNDELLRILFLQHLGFSPRTGDFWLGIGWFAIVFFWVSLFYFYINKLFGKQYLNLIVWMLIIFSFGLGFNSNNFNIIGHTVNILNCFNTGVLRALGCMGIGYFILMLYQTNFLKNCSKFAQIVITGLELYCCTFLIHYTCFSSNIPGKSPLTYIVIFSILFYLFLRKQGIISKFLDKKVFGFGGKYSYSMYIMHAYIVNLFLYLLAVPHRDFLAKNIGWLFPVQVFTAIIFSIGCYYLVEKPATKYLSEKFLKK